MLQYYNRPFLYFHKDLNEKIFQGTFYLRKNFWSLIPEGRYSYIDGKQLFEQYFKSIESRIKEITNKYSAAYWLHLSRRILPNSPGTDKSPETILTVRTILNSTIQKYGQTEFCTHVGKSKEVDISKVFNGLLLSDEFEIERKIIELAPNQLILTDFTQLNLVEYYELEKLCYEIWFCEAKMRGLQKGAIIEVDLEDEEFVKEFRNDELAELIASYDSRHSGFFSSETGTVFTNETFDKASDIFIPYLNFQHVTVDELNEFFEKIFNFTTGKEYIPNFLIVPFSMSKYLNAHLPFDIDFQKKNQLPFQSILFVITALCFRYFYISAKKEYPAIVTVLQRGYEGPLELKEILHSIKEFKKHTKHLLKLSYEFSDKEINKAVQYLTIENKSEINLMYSGTLKMFIPVGEKRLYIDYSTIIDILNNLFYDIDLNKHNFRGLTLEMALNETKSFLPTKPCKNNEGREKQIDFSVKIDKLLIIGECKVVARSLGFYTGDIKALQYRNAKVIERGLSEVDEKAQWLAKNPKGRNYSLHDIDYILPIAISPFKEFIPSTNNYYWINKGLPRVVTISELKDFIKVKAKDGLLNLVKINSG